MPPFLRTAKNIVTIYTKGYPYFYSNDCTYIGLIKQTPIKKTTIHIIDVHTLQVVASIVMSFNMDLSPLIKPVFSPTNNFIAIPTSDTIIIWDIVNKKIHKKIKCSHNCCSDNILLFNHDSSILLECSINISNFDEAVIPIECLGTLSPKTDIRKMRIRLKICAMNQADLTKTMYHTFQGTSVLLKSASFNSDSSLLAISLEDRLFVYSFITHCVIFDNQTSTASTVAFDSEDNLIITDKISIKRFNIAHIKILQTCCLPQILALWYSIHNLRATQRLLKKYIPHINPELFSIIKREAYKNFKHELL